MNVENNFFAGAFIARTVADRESGQHNSDQTYTWGLFHGRISFLFFIYVNLTFAKLTAMTCHIAGWLYLLKLWQLIFANLLAVGTAEGKSAFLILFQCGGNISLQDGALPFLLR